MPSEYCNYSNEIVFRFPLNNYESAFKKYHLPGCLLAVEVAWGEVELGRVGLRWVGWGGVAGGGGRLSVNKWKI